MALREPLTAAVSSSSEVVTFISETANRTAGAGTLERVTSRFVRPWTTQWEGPAVPEGPQEECLKDFLTLAGPGAPRGRPACRSAARIVGSAVCGASVLGGSSTPWSSMMSKVTTYTGSSALPQGIRQARTQPPPRGIHRTATTDPCGPAATTLHATAGEERVATEEGPPPRRHRRSGQSAAP